jgi:phosphoribosyl-AMP cyclohydrolase
MINDFFLPIEESQQGEQLPLSTVLDNLAFDARGLIPVTTQDHLSGEVLMMAWMNRSAIEETLASGDMTYWSRSRSQLWRKGETSGHRQTLKSMRVDCDGDALLCEVVQLGAACHTGRKTCFYLQVDRDSSSVRTTESKPATVNIDK